MAASPVLLLQFRRDRFDELRDNLFGSLSLHDVAGNLPKEILLYLLACPPPTSVDNL